MKTALAILAATMLAQSAPLRVQQLILRLSDGGAIRYAISVPRDYSPSLARPLVLSLHPGGAGGQNAGAAFMRSVVAPGLQDLGAIIIAPDSPAASWAEPAAERAVMALVEHVFADYSVDRRRVLVTGFSVGGGGTWFLAARHADVFTAAMPIAGSAAETPADQLSHVPTYVIHSRKDEVMSFEGAERTVRALQQLGRTVVFDALEEPRHYQMTAYIEAVKRGSRWVADRWRDAGSRPQ